MMNTKRTRTLTITIPYSLAVESSIAGIKHLLSQVAKAPPSTTFPCTAFKVTKAVRLPVELCDMLKDQAAAAGMTILDYTAALLNAWR